VHMGCGRRTFRTTSHNERDIAGSLDEDTNFVRFCGLIGTIRGYVARTHGHIEHIGYAKTHRLKIKARIRIIGVEYIHYSVPISVA
jgi:hypothetical protein